MRLKILGSSSAGNCYLLDNGQECLIIELGVNFGLIKRGLDFNVDKVVGILVTHSHMDHCKGALEAARFGLNIYASKGTCEEMIGIFSPIIKDRLKEIQAKKPFRIGNFRVMPFDVQHDTKEPLGFLIDHPETGTILFLTDTVYSPYSFPGLTQMIVEANYCEDILEEKRRNGATIAMLRDRVIESHLSFQNTKELLKANDLSGVRNIVLIHLSNAHSHADRFKLETEQLTGKRVTVADKGVEINLDKSPF